MHEFSLVRSLLTQVDATVFDSSEDSNRISVRSIVVSCGPLSGVEPLLVREAFDVLKLEQAKLPSDCRLEILDEPLCAVCESCDKETIVENFHFQCSSCGSDALQITSGDAFKLLRIEIEEHNELESETGAP
jgi:hydrogenase nickel incorporation protein HypA/HybF